MININKPIVCRDGTPARIICSDLIGGSPLVVALEIIKGKEFVSVYNITGKYAKDDHHFDLINVE
jgi:hypothetical protein